MRAVIDGSDNPGRTATRKRTRLVSGIIDDATTQLSSQDFPVGSSIPK